MARPKVGEILVQAGLIDESQLRAALADQRSWGQPLGITLVKLGVIEERDLMRALAQQLHLPVVELDGKRVQPEVLALVPAEFADEHLCVPLFVKEKGGVQTLFLGMDDPCRVEVLDDLAFRAGMQVQPVLVSPSELCEAVDRFYRRKEVELGSSDGASRSAADEMPVVHESLFRDLSQEAAPSPAPPPAAPVAAAASDRTVLRALCHLLIEKGVIERDELARLVREAAVRDGGPGSG